jgi:hypothetical protein
MAGLNQSWTATCPELCMFMSMCVFVLEGVKALAQLAFW